MTNKLITNVISIKLRKLNTEYRRLYDQILALQERKQDLELELLKVNTLIFNLNRRLDEIEEQIVDDVDGPNNR